MLDRRRLHIFCVSPLFPEWERWWARVRGCKSSLAAASCVVINGLFIICLVGIFVARSRVHHFTMQPVWTVNEGLHGANGALCRVSLSRRNYEWRTFDRLERASTQLTPTFARTTRDGCPHGCRCHKSIAAPIPLAVSDLLSFCTTLSPLSAAAQGHPWAYQCPFNFFLTSRGCRHTNISFLSSCCFPPPE